MKKSMTEPFKWFACGDQEDGRQKTDQKYLIVKFWYASIRSMIVNDGEWLRIAQETTTPNTTKTRVRKWSFSGASINRLISKRSLFSHTKNTEYNDRTKPLWSSFSKPRSRQHSRDGCRFILMSKHWIQTYLSTERKERETSCFCQNV